MKDLIKKIPIIGKIAQSVYHKLSGSPQPGGAENYWSKPFTGSENYWINRYKLGGNSGDGSYSKLAEFKAKILNEFVAGENIKTVIEYGSGDGNQLKLATYPQYIGFDVSPEAIKMCEETFHADTTKRFKLATDYQDETAELTLSLDVIYHLVEDEIFEAYMHRLFDSSEKFVIIYASNTDQNPDDMSAHVKHRKFSNWVEAMKPGWSLLEHIPNKYPFSGDTKSGSFADFFIYKKSA